MNVTNNGIPYSGAFFTPHSHPSWAQIFASGPNTLSLRSSLNVRDHTSQPYNTTDNIIGSHKNILPHDKPLAEMSLLTGYQSDCRQQGQLCYRGFQNYEFYLNEDGGDSSQLGYSKDIK